MVATSTPELRSFCGHEPTDDVQAATSPRKWSRLDLTIKARQSYIRPLVYAAAAKISAVCGLNIVPNDDLFFSLADLKLEMVSTVHNDAFPFDGPGGVLAHMAYPEAGWGHFEQIENWSMAPDEPGYSFAAVALHELMHGAGVAHTQNLESVIYPYLRSTGDWTWLRPYDIEVLQDLYGPNTTVIPADGASVDWSFDGIDVEKRWTEDAQEMGDDLVAGKIKARTYVHDPDGTVWKTFGVRV